MCPVERPTDDPDKMLVNSCTLAEANRKLVIQQVHDTPLLRIVSTTYQVVIALSCIMVFNLVNIRDCSVHTTDIMINHHGRLRMFVH